MSEVFINTNCPSCGRTFRPDLTLGNLCRCEACKQWSIIAGDQISEKVIYKIIPFQVDRSAFRDALAKTIGDTYEKDAYRSLGSISVSSFYLPVREIGEGPHRNIIPANRQYRDLHTFLFHHQEDSEKVACAVYDGILEAELQTDFTEELMNSNARMLETDLDKTKQDREYGIFRDDFYKIMYLPVYEISFTENEGKWLCLGLKDLPGLRASILHVKGSDGEGKYGCLGRSLIVFTVLCGLVQCSNISSEGFGVFEYPVHLAGQLLWGLLKGFLISAAVWVLFLLWQYRKEKARLEDIAKIIHE